MKFNKIIIRKYVGAGFLRTISNKQKVPIVENQICWKSKGREVMLWRQVFKTFFTIIWVEEIKLLNLNLFNWNLKINKNWGNIWFFLKKKFLTIWQGKEAATWKFGWIGSTYFLILF